MTEITNPDHDARQSSQASARVTDRENGLHVGRIAVTRPMFGHLDVYCKRDGSRGATVVCESDGLKYGVTAGVLKHYSQAGTYAGWAYVVPNRDVVFRFDVGDAGAEPRCLLAIEAQDGRINVPPAVGDGLVLQHGQAVAFYARSVRDRSKDAVRRQATKLFALDDEHVPLICRLVVEEKLSFPEHCDVLTVMFDCLTDAHGNGSQGQPGRLDGALAVIAEKTGVPEELQRLARVERTRLAAAGGPAGFSSASATSGKTGGAGAKDIGHKTTARPAKASVVADVFSVDLKLE